MSGQMQRWSYVHTWQPERLKLFKEALKQGLVDGQRHEFKGSVSRGRYHDVGMVVKGRYGNTSTLIYLRQEMIGSLKSGVVKRL